MVYNSIYGETELYTIFNDPLFMRRVYGFDFIEVNDVLLKVFFNLIGILNKALDILMKKI